MITRTIRDIYTADIESIWIDQPDALERGSRLHGSRAAPSMSSGSSTTKAANRSSVQYKIEEEISRIQSRRVPLPAGGSSSSTRPKPSLPSTSTAETSATRTPMPRRTPTRSTRPQLRKSPARSGSATWAE